MFSNLNCYKIVEVQRKLNQNVMIRKLQFFIPTKNLIKMFKAPTLPPAKRKSCDNPTFELSLERYENKDLDVLVYWTVSTPVLIYKQNQPFAYVLRNGYSWKPIFFTRKHQWRDFFFYEIAVLLFAVCKFIKKETLAQLSSYEFCDIFKKTFLIEHCCFYIKLIIDFESQ